jgi:hypothetical protein
MFTITNLEQVRVRVCPYDGHSFVVPNRYSQRVNCYEHKYIYSLKEYRKEYYLQNKEHICEMEKKRRNLKKPV